MMFKLPEPRPATIEECLLSQQLVRSSTQTATRIVRNYPKPRRLTLQRTQELVHLEKQRKSFGEPKIILSPEDQEGGKALPLMRTGRWGSLLYSEGWPVIMVYHSHPREGNENMFCVPCKVG